jgi:hypothetical protein
MIEFRAETEICVWLYDWDVWPSGQWHHLFQRFRASYGLADDLLSRPAHVVRGEEIEAATSIAVYAALMLWDCHVLGASGRPFLFYSHDEFGKRRAKQSVDPTPVSAPRDSGSHSQD